MKSVAHLTVPTALDQILDALPEMELAVSAGNLVWRRGAFAPALASLPVIAPDSPPISPH